jgi:hypothetical protein
MVSEFWGLEEEYNINPVTTYGILLQNLLTTSHNCLL